MTDLLVKDVMSTAVKCVSPDAPVSEAAATMAAHKCSCVVIAERGVPLGLLTERDLVRVVASLASADHQAITSLAAQFMSTPLITVSPETAVFTALVLCETRNIRHLPVVNLNGELAGIVSQSDLVRVNQLLVEQRKLIIEREVNSRTKALADAYAELKNQSLQDPLLSVGNRRAMEIDLEYTHEAARRYSQDYSLALFDVDDFKAYNDLYGHLAGDEALKRVVMYLRSIIRKSDRIYRFGGEELLLLMPQTLGKDACTLARRSITGIAALAIPHEGAPHGVLTASCGVAEGDKSLGAQAALIAADNALYEAKRAGKNRVIAANDPSRNHYETAA